MTKKIMNLDQIKDYLNCKRDVNSLKADVTPDQAKFLLKNCNRANRRIKRNHVETLKRDMESGNWYSDVDYIGFDKSGALINGQHRLKALSESNLKSLSLKIDFDVEQHVSMDTGRNRGYADQVRIYEKMGEEIMPNKYRMIIIAGLKLSNPKIKLSNTELCKIWDVYGEDVLFCERKGLFNLGSKANALTVKSSILWARLSGVPLKTLKHIADVLRDGITESKNDIPIIRLRDALIDLKNGGKGSEIKRAAYTQQCIYNVLDGSTSNRLPSNPIMHYQDFPFLERIK